VIIAAVLISQNSPYLSWDFNDPETAVVGTFFHAFEWFFFRLAPVALIGTIVGIVLTRQRK
jgi:putative transcriptional regulator